MRSAVEHLKEAEEWIAAADGFDEEGSKVSMPSAIMALAHAQIALAILTAEESAGALRALREGS